MKASVAVCLFVLWVGCYWGILGIWNLLGNSFSIDEALTITWGFAIWMIVYHTNKD